MEHQAKDEKKWKSCFIIFSEVTIANDIYIIDEFTFKVDEIPEIIQSDKSSQFKLLTNSFTCEGSVSVDNAHLKAIIGIKIFLNRISLIGYCETRIVGHLITTVEKCEVGEKFLVLSSVIHNVRKFKHEITPGDLVSLTKTKESYLETSLSLLKRALSTQSLEEKILMLSSCLERLGLEECKEYTKLKCQKCGYEEFTNNKATKKYSKEILKQKGATLSSINNFLERDRNKIAHGGGERNVAFYSELKQSILKIQSLVVEIMANRYNTHLVNSQTSIVDLPFVVYPYEKNLNGYTLSKETIRFSSTAGISGVNNMSERAKGNLTFEIGVSFNESNPIINTHFQKVFFP